MTAGKIPIFDDYQIVHHAYLDLLNLIKAIPTWLNVMQYDFYEKGLVEKDIGTGHELESAWVAERDVTPYFQFQLNVTVFCRDLKKVTFEDGSTGYWARLIITINTTLIKDHRGRFAGHGYEKLLQGLYERYIIHDTIKKYIGKLALESVNLAETLKKHLK